MKDKSRTFFCSHTYSLPFFLKKKRKVFISKEICTECLKKSNKIVRPTNLNDYVYNNKSETEEKSIILAEKSLKGLND